MRLEWFYVDNLDNSLFLFKNLVFEGGGGDEKRCIMN